MKIIKTITQKTEYTVGPLNYIDDGSISISLIAKTINSDGSISADYAPATYSISALDVSRIFGENAVGGMPILSNITNAILSELLRQQVVSGELVE